MASAASSSLPLPVTISDGWQLQDAAKVPETGAMVALASYKPRSWYTATVPGTILTSLVKDGVYPEPLYGENNRPDKNRCWVRVPLRTVPANVFETYSRSRPMLWFPRARV